MRDNAKPVDETPSVERRRPPAVARDAWADHDAQTRSDLGPAVVAGFEPFRDGRDVVLQSKVRIAIGRK